MIRHLMERLSRGTAIRRRLPNQFGNRPLYLSADSALSYLKPQWAKAHASLLAAASKYASGARAVWDIGGNCGVFTLAAAHVAKPDAEIVAVEADPFLASLLQKSVNDRENADKTIHVLCAAASDRQGLDRFLIAQRGRSSNSLEQAERRTQTGGTRYMHFVPTITLDGLLQQFAKPDLIKIDVEGAEALVLKGAQEILKTVRPLLYVEVGEEQNADVTTLLRNHGYRLFNGDSTDEAAMERCVFNTLAVPVESQRTNA
jgi:FkbM family methyltransferase